MQRILPNAAGFSTLSWLRMTNSVFDWFDRHARTLFAATRATTTT